MQVNNFNDIMYDKREYGYRVEPRDVDLKGCASIMSLANYLLHVAGEDADCNGFGIRQLNKRCASWVLSRMAIETMRMPQEYEMIRVTTWVSAVSRAMTTRNFEIIDEQGNIVASAVTNWVMIDVVERKMLDLHNLSDYNSITQDYPLPIEAPVRLAAISGGQEYEHKVVYSDLDFNGHANSVKYLQWVVDLIPIVLIEQQRVARLDMNFLHETYYGEELKIVALVDDGYCFEVRNQLGNVACRIAMGFK